MSLDLVNVNRPFIDFVLIFVKLIKGNCSLEDTEGIGRTSMHILHMYVLYFSTTFSLLSLSLTSKLTDSSVLSLQFLASRQKIGFGEME